MHAIARNCACAGRRRCKYIKLAHAKWSIKPRSNFGERSCIYMSTSRKEPQTVRMTNCPHTWLWLLKENEGVEGGAEALRDAFFTLKHFLRWLEKLIKTYHLSSIAILELLEEVREDLEPETRRSHSKLWSWFVTALNVEDCSHQQALGGEVGRNSDQGPIGTGWHSFQHVLGLPQGGLIPLQHSRNITPGRLPVHTSEPPLLAPLTLEEQQFYSKTAWRIFSTLYKKVMSKWKAL